MANQEHLNILKQGVEIWNQWRQKHPGIRPDLNGANLRHTDLSGVNLSYAYLSGIHLEQSNLSEADLRGARLEGATLFGTVLTRSNLVDANLSRAMIAVADLTEANLSKSLLVMVNLVDANLTRANLNAAHLDSSLLVRTNLTGAILTNCSVYGISAWNVQLAGAKQNNLDITPGNEPTITVDNLEIAQFIYLLLNNQNIRNVIDTITSKVVLILGRFTPERKAVLDAIREELRKRNYSPVLFDFEKPSSRDITETVSTLAHIARFVIADLTDAKSIPQELMMIVPHLPSVPIQPLILTSQREYGMFEHFTRFPWVLPIYHYTDEESLLQSLKENIIESAEQKAKELAQ